MKCLVSDIPEKGRPMSSVLDTLKEIRPECDFLSSSDFFHDGLLDSFDLITLTSILDKAHRISIEGTDILPENFKSVSAIRDLLSRYGVKDDPALS
jgi:acyl carrier protein